MYQNLLKKMLLWYFRWENESMAGTNSMDGEHISMNVERSIMLSSFLSLERVASYLSLELLALAMVQIGKELEAVRRKP